MNIGNWGEISGMVTMIATSKKYALANLLYCNNIDS